MTKNTVEFESGVPGWAAALLVEVIIAILPVKIPKPIVVLAVTGILSVATSIDLETIRAILKKLGAPGKYARDILDGFTERVTEDAAEVECPESGTTVSLDDGDGEYTCPVCDMDIFVEGGVAEHADAPEVECPESGDVISLGPDAVYKCPDCKQDIDVEDGIAKHAALVSCPADGEDYWVGPEAGEYTCPGCDDDIVVDDDGDAEHA